MGKAIITVQMPADASIGPNIGWFEGGEQEDTGEDEVRLAGALLPSRKTYEALSALALCGDQVEPMRPADLWVPGDDHAGRCRPVPGVRVNPDMPGRRRDWTDGHDRHPRSGRQRGWA